MKIMSDGEALKMRPCIDGGFVLYRFLAVLESAPSRRTARGKEFSLSEPLATSTNWNGDQMEHEICQECYGNGYVVVADLDETFGGVHPVGTRLYKNCSTCESQGTLPGEAPPRELSNE